VTQSKIARAWLLLCFALAVHVADEALTGFLSVYNPTVHALTQTVPWLPLPVFTFKVWITGLALAVAALSLLTPWIARAGHWTRPAAYVFAAVMLANALGHTAGTIAGQTVASVHFSRPMPGFYSSPLLLAASVLLLVRLRGSSLAGRE
jgi:hypothetical protein